MSSEGVGISDLLEELKQIRKLLQDHYEPAECEHEWDRGGSNGKGVYQECGKCGAKQSCFPKPELPKKIDLPQKEGSIFYISTQHLGTTINALISWGKGIEERLARKEKEVKHGLAKD